MHAYNFARDTQKKITFYFFFNIWIYGFIWEFVSNLFSLNRRKLFSVVNLIINLTKIYQICEIFAPQHNFYNFFIYLFYSTEYLTTALAFLKKFLLIQEIKICFVENNCNNVLFLNLNTKINKWIWNYLFVIFFSFIIIIKKRPITYFLFNDANSLFMKYTFF